MIAIFKSKYLLIPAVLIFFIALLIINSAFTFYNDKAIVENNSLKIETETVKRITSLIITDIVHGADLSVRGFALTKNEQLADPIRLVLKNKDSVFNTLGKLLTRQRYDITKFVAMRAAVENYLTFSMEMIQLARQDSMKQFTELLNEDRGYKVWKEYEAFYVPLFAYEDGLNATADEKFENALSRNRIIQIMLMLLGIPGITYVIWKLKSERDQREEFLTSLDQNNRKYIFDTGVSLEVSDWKEAVAYSIKNFQHANEFISRISAGDYITEWAGLNQTNHSLNQANIAGNLVKMREHLKQTKIEEERRNWTVSGIAKFAEIIRDQTDFQKLGDAIISNIVKYTHSNQGGLFVVDDGDKNEMHLRLLSCYAWDKKKHIEKTIREGQGMAGQCWQEGTPIFMTQVPSDYVTITSGLGHATPRCLFLAPLKVNDVIYGVLELASFQPYQEHEREFIVKVCETIASAIATSKIAQQTKYLLGQSQQQTEAMRSQEEEMRQNMEELQTTQEEMKRFQLEIQTQTTIINSLAIVSRANLKGDITFVNDEFCKWSKYSREEVIGKNHRILKSGHQSDEIFKDLWKTISTGKIWRGEVKNKAKDGSYYWVDAIIAPVLDNNGKPKEYIAQRFVINDKKENEEKIRTILAESQTKANELQAQEEELRATMETEAQRNKDLERASSQAEAQKQMMLKVIEKLKEKEKESYTQASELRAQEEELRAQQEELRQNMEELEATLDAEAKRSKEAERNNAQLEAQKQIMIKSLENFKQREKELMTELEQKERAIANLTKTISDN